MTTAEFRYRMMERGWMNKSDLAKFLEVGRKNAEKAFNRIMSDVKREGFENIDENTILTKRAIAFVGLSERKIIEAYERDKKKG